MSSKNTNKLNIPEAKAAMDKFKMEAASEEDVYPPQRIFPTLDFWLKYRKNRLSRKNQFLRWKHLVWNKCIFVVDIRHIPATEAASSRSLFACTWRRLFPETSPIKR